MYCYKKSIKERFSMTNKFSQAVKGNKMTTSFSTFDGSFCISWRTAGGIAQIFVQDKTKAEALFKQMQAVKSRSSLVILSQGEKALKLA